MNHLRPMTPEEFRLRMIRLVSEYAEDHVRAGQWTPEDAPREAQKETDQLLPQGLDTPHHHFFSIVAPPQGEVAGNIWFCSKMAQEPGRGFVYDLYVDTAYRGQGLGRAAMVELEPFARSLGLRSIGLHVFGHNKVAIALYEKLGYAPTNIRMSKDLAP